jgi:hypothetical protein
VILNSLPRASPCSPAGIRPTFAASTNLADYRWGKLHRITFAHPLAAPQFSPSGRGLPPSLAGLPGPRAPAASDIDVANHPVRVGTVSGTCSVPAVSPVLGEATPARINIEPARRRRRVPGPLTSTCSRWADERRHPARSRPAPSFPGPSEGDSREDSCFRRRGLLLVAPLARAERPPYGPQNSSVQPSRTAWTDGFRTAVIWQSSGTGLPEPAGREYASVELSTFWFRPEGRITFQEVQIA